MKILKFIPLIFLVFLIVIFSINLNNESNQKDVLISPLIGKKIPRNEISLLKNNELINLNDIYNNIYAVNFFASWCLPCKVEAPLIEKLAEKIPVFGIAFKDKKSNILNFLNSYGNPYDKIGIDDNGNLGIEWGVYGIPETFIVSKNGKIIYKHTGPLNFDELNYRIYNLINNEK